MTSPDSPSLSRGTPEMNEAPDKMLVRLAHGAGPFRDGLEIEVINWLANRELFRRAPALSEGEPTPALTDWIDPEMTARELAELGAPPASPLPDSPGLSERIEEFEQSIVDYDKSEWPEDAETEEEDAALNRISDARSSLEELFRVQETEIQRLRNARILDGTEIGRLLSENERLRATALTPRQAFALRYICEDYQSGITPEDLSPEEVQDTLAKLRLISAELP